MEHLWASLLTKPDIYLILVHFIQIVLPLWIQEAEFGKTNVNYFFLLQIEFSTIPGYFRQ